MGENAKVKTNDTVPAEFKKPDTFRVAPITVYGSFNDYLADTQKIYDENEEEFLGSDVADAGLPEKSDRWAKAARTLIMGACALFGKYPQKAENKTRALDILDRCKKDSGIREKNLMLHYELAKQNDSSKQEDLYKLRGKVLDSLQFFFRAENTQMAYLRRYISSPDYVSPEFRIEKEQGKRVYEKMQMVPKGHIFLPARPFPPERIPEGMRVPYPPEPFVEFKNLPLKDYIYDSEHDEFILPKGYLSEDGRIDDQSVVWNWEENTVTCKFVGGEPVTWPFWKPKDIYDVLKEGSWCLDYLIRLNEQYLDEQEPAGYCDDP